MNLPRVVVIGESLSMAERVQLLKDALSLDNTNEKQVVAICADIDLTGERGIEIWDCRSVIAPRRFARSHCSPGPRVYITDKEDRGRDSLFEIVGDNVRVSGFRLEGPTPYIGHGNRHEKGILVAPPAMRGDVVLPPIRNVVIANMEIYNWSGVGVQVQDAYDDRAPHGRLLRDTPEAVRILDCYFHHNRHGSGEGYGVNSQTGAYLAVERCVFEQNRHAIAGGSRKDGKAYSGYTARDNLILPGGGIHVWEPSAYHAGWVGLAGAIIGGLVGFAIGGFIGAAIGAAVGAALFGGWVLAGMVAYQTHQIDMHGTKNARGKEEWCCGTAGETIIIERNTVLYDGKPSYWWMLPRRGPAISIRGNPLDKAVTRDNVFRHPDVSSAFSQNGEPGHAPTNPIQGMSDNTFRCPDFTRPVLLGKGDFYGDRVEDDFMASGATWWVRHPVGGQWRYLNTMTERLPELSLEKVDNDAVCDVAPRIHRRRLEGGLGSLPEKYSKGGRTPWQPVVQLPPN
jgi:hypothetical protein